MSWRSRHLAHLGCFGIIPQHFRPVILFSVLQSCSTKVYYNFNGACKSAYLFVEVRFIFRQSYFLWIKIRKRLGRINHCMISEGQLNPYSFNMSPHATNGSLETPPRAPSPVYEFGTLAVHAGSPHDPSTGAVIESVC